MTIKARWPVFDSEQVQAVSAVLQSGKVNYWTGTEGKRFEQEYAAYLGVKHAIAVTNGTAALELALHAVGVGDGDEVVVPSRTFIGTASAVVARGGRPIIADIDRFSNNVTADSIHAACSPRTRAIIVVHVGGWPCDMHSILEFAHSREIPVIEDCAQAHGGVYRGRPVGSLGAISAFSFCQDKIITTGGEGGLVATDDPALWERAWSYKDHGKSFARVNNKHGNLGFRYLHETFGTNMRMTEMQAAIGRVQLRRLAEFHHARASNVHTLTRHLEACPGLILPHPGYDCKHAYYRFYGLVEPTVLKDGWTRDRILAELCDEGIPVGTGSCGEIYREKAFDSFGPHARLPNAQYVQDNSLAFLVDPTFDEADMVRIAGRVRQLFQSIVTTDRPALSNAA
jgi:dTDP-4-amino-4,6-dideoxygalactose transaminase